ncbi:MAG: AAA family ATPase [Planctomycetaceae bacterium]|nr:AAA family ATPase [Planctomycetaceae bacterium]
MANNLTQAECNLVAALVFCPRLIDELSVEPVAITDPAARDLLLLARFVYRQHGDDRPISIWELQEASDSIPERPLSHHEGSTLAATLLNGELLTGQAAGNWALVRKAWRRRRLVERLAQQTRPDIDVDEAVAELRRLCDDLENEGVGKARVAPMTLSKLVQDYPTLRRPVIDGVIRQGETGSLNAKSKVGKSFMTYGIAISVATGRQLWGRYNCAPGRVLLVDNELHPEVLASRISTVAQAMGLSVDDLTGRLDVVSLRGRLMGLEEIGKMVRRASEPYLLVIIDALYRVLLGGTQENSNDDMKVVYNTIDTMARETGAAYLLVHHASKGGQSDKDVVDVGSGAGAMARAVDAHVVVRPHEAEDVVVVDAAVRSFAPVEPFCLAWTYPLWSPADDCDPNQLKRLPTKQEQRQANKDGEAAGQIVEKIRLAGGELTLTKIREETGFSRDRALRIIAQMEQDGRVSKQESNVRGNQCVTYRLADYLMGSRA